LTRAAVIAPAIAACIALTVLAGPAESASSNEGPSRSQRYAADFNAFWKFVSETYAYFDRKETDWERARELHRPAAVGAESDSAFLRALEGALAELYDSHAHLGANTPASPRLVPSGTDLWAEWRGGRATITGVRGRSAAEKAGLRAGMLVERVAGRPVEEAVAALLPRSLRKPDPAARDWALRVALAGTHDAPVRLTAAVEGGAASAFEFRPGVARPDRPLDLEAASPSVAWIRLHDSLGDTRTIAAFDSALVAARASKGLILDLRDTPSGGTSTVARGILSRLVAGEAAYQRHELPSEERAFGVKRVWVEHVAPRGSSPYRAPIVALVGRWTGSMGEGLAIGLDGMKRAVVLGTPMAGLLGALYQESLPNTNIVVRIPAERLYHVAGAPREEWVPRPPAGGPDGQAGPAAGTTGSPVALDDPLVREAVRILEGT
jgi:carboxyl-terminal processing protease